MFDDNYATSSSKAQNALEKKILPLYQELDGVDPEEDHDLIELHRDLHIAYLHGGLGQLSSSFAVLDASRTWIVYWIVHSLALLNAPLPPNIRADDVAEFLRQCQHPEGGFGGGPMQLAHLAPTYAAVAAAVTIGGRALDMVDRVAARDFLYRMCIPPEQGGGFRVHDGGEGDLRACYTAMATAHLLGLDDDREELLRRSGMVDYVRRCQTYEGGLGGEPGNEAHGGYTFCGTAALVLAGGPGLLAATLDVPRLLHWLVHRQGSMEGGFNGRTNKLVDGCYSFWQGGVLPLLQSLPPEALRPPLVPPEAAPAQDVEAPPAPMLGAIPPFDLAEEEMHSRMMAYEGARSSALAANEAAEALLRERSSRYSTAEAADARKLLDAAAAAHEAAELATTQFACCNVAASNICPPSDPDMLLQQQLQHAAANPGAPPLPALLCNWDALQLWILRCCQSSKGGLRDKPGKPVDYYHTCYCLSGLAAAQHAPGGRVLGPADVNALRPADPAANVVLDRLAAARQHYAARPLPPRAAA